MWSREIPIPSIFGIHRGRATQKHMARTTPILYLISMFNLRPPTSWPCGHGNRMVSKLNFYANSSQRLHQVTSSLSVLLLRTQRPNDFHTQTVTVWVHTGINYSEVFQVLNIPKLYQSNHPRHYSYYQLVRWKLYRYDPNSIAQMVWPHADNL